MTENWAQNGVLTPHFCRCKLCVPCLLRWVRTRVLGDLGPKTSMTEKKNGVRTSFIIYKSACVIISLIASVVMCRIIATFQTWSLAHFCPIRSK